ncbi:MAG: helix-turn-helix domain-containing protein [Clostridia bacterium]|nr:helix-turn-helix domain-containing protein [Clostridia bacterium]
MFSINALSENIKKHRLRLGLSQRELAIKTGVSVQAVSKWERGYSAPELVTVFELSRIFSVSIDELLSGGANRAPAYIGIDGGGTKTEFVLFLADGEILGRTVLSSTNPNTVGMEDALSVLKRGIDTLLPLAKSRILGIYAGMAGMLSGDNQARVASFLTESYPHIPSAVTTDIYNVIASATRLDRCIAAIAGTGTVVYAKVGNEVHRFGGWGYLLDEGGSGFDLGREALRAVLRENEGYGERTALTPLIEEKLGSQPFARITELYSGAPASIAALSPLVFKAAEDGDRVARDIIKDGARHLAARITEARARYETGDTVVISGGLMNASSLWLPMLCEELSFEPRIVVPRLPQIFGACRRALSLFGDGAMLSEEKFIPEYEKIIKKEDLPL